MPYVASARLDAGSATGSASGARYTVPSGIRTIVKWVSVYNTHNAYNYLSLNIYNAGGTFIQSIGVEAGAAGALGAMQHVQVWVVMNEGDYFTVGASASAMDYIVSGAELRVPS